MFTLDQARAFVAVAEERHFGRAAERLHMTQPPLSRQIQKLEKELDILLLRREARGVGLTAAGEAFLTECHQLLTKADQAPRRAQLVAAGQVGVVRLGYTAASSYALLGPLLARFHEHAPRVSIELHEMVTPDQLEALESGAIDLGIGRPPFPRDRFSARLLLTEELVVAMPSEHPLAHKTHPITVTELEEETIVLHSPTKARYFYDLTARIMTIRREQISYTTSQVLTMVGLVAAGHGIALVPKSVEIFAGGYDIVTRPIAGAPNDLVQLHAMWESASENPALRTLIPLLGDPSEPAPPSIVPSP